jgi:2',3'-cyclic-nucleotide 2'-phosphodiesterase/3'-nucleotidase
VPQGPLAINNAADLYLYPNTVYAVKVTGAQVKAWLEEAAKRFNTIDPTQATVQQLVSSYPGYNFDMFTTPDLTYSIDVTKAVGSRISNLQYKGAAIDPAGQFIVATNNYRGSGGGNFPGLDGSNVIYASPDANRDVLIAYIKKLGTVARATNGSQRSWHFTTVPGSVALVQFPSIPNRIADATAAGITNVTQVAADDGSGKGLAVYQIDLTK